MNHQFRLEVTDRDGWRKVFQVEKAIVYVGSDAGDDVSLDRMRGGGVSPRHIQLIAPSAAGGPYRLVNLGDGEVAVGSPASAGERAVAPRSFASIADGETLRLGDFRLVFRAEDQLQPMSAGNGSYARATAAAAPAQQSSSGAIGLRLSLPSGQISADYPLSGSVIVSNQGGKPGVQFRLDVEGFGAESYELGPGPLLFPGAEKAVPLRLTHTRVSRPAAGAHVLTVRATAPDAYPGDFATVSQEIIVLPFYAHTIRLESGS